MPTNFLSQIVRFPTPRDEDQVFYEIRDRSMRPHADLKKGDSHPDAKDWPDHLLVDIQPVTERGDKMYAFVWAAKREFENLYNWEHAQADLGDHKFDVVSRSYIVLRDDYDPLTPAIGAVMPNEPKDQFTEYASYILAARNQDRISERGRRAQQTIGGAELDSLFVVETRTYIKRSTITKRKTDPSLGGSLKTVDTLYYRGETYGTPPVAIETAMGTASYWGVSSDGQSTEVEQVSDNWFVVTTQDLIPQGLASGTYGKKLREFETFRNISLPTVMGSSAVELIPVSRKNGSSTATVNLHPDKRAYSGPVKMTIEQCWSSTAATLGSVEQLDNASMHYAGVQYSVSFRNALFPTTAFIDNVGTADQVYEQGSYGTTHTGTTVQDWPASGSVISLTQEPWRGGYLITEMKYTQPTFS